MAQQNATVNWAGLPLVIKEMIMQKLADKQHGRDSPEDRKNRASYAAVSSEWQHFFEARSFGKLVLHPSALEDFQRIIQRRQNLDPVRKADRMKLKRRPKRPAGEYTPPVVSRMPRIEHIWLRVELGLYDCRTCREPENTLVRARNDGIFTTALWKLLDVLSTWENTDRGHGQDLTLELSAHSPSDSQHFFQDHIGLQDDYPYLADMGVQKEFVTRCHHDPTSKKNQLVDVSHGFQDEEHTPVLLNQDWRLMISGANRLIRPLEIDFTGIQFRKGQKKNRLPEVKMVSTFLTRRQYYRDLSPSALDKLFTHSLTGLRHIRHERWRVPWDLGQKMFKMDYGPTDTWNASGGGTVLGSSLPSSLESLHLFEDFDSSIHGTPEDPSTRPEPGVKVLRAVASSAPNLKHLSVSFLSDAADCLDIPPGATFPNLESLALTTQTNLERDPAQVNQLLRRAAAVAARMPKLQIMELWSCGGGHADVVRFEATGTSWSSACRLTWRSSWCDRAWAVVRRAAEDWGQVAASAGRELDVVVDPLPEGSYAEYGDVIHHLKLGGSVLHPLSAMQVRVGTEGEGQPEVEAWRSVTLDSFWETFGRRR